MALGCSSDSVVGVSGVAVGASARLVNLLQSAVHVAPEVVAGEDVDEEIHGKVGDVQRLADVLGYLQPHPGLYGDVPARHLQDHGNGDPDGVVGEVEQEENDGDPHQHLGGSHLREGQRLLGRGDVEVVSLVAVQGFVHHVVADSELPHGEDDAEVEDGDEDGGHGEDDDGVDVGEDYVEVSEGLVHVAQHALGGGGEERGGVDDDCGKAQGGDDCHRGAAVTHTGHSEGGRGEGGKGRLFQLYIH